MIPLGEERRLGHNAYYIMAAERSTVGVALLAVALFVSIVGQGIPWVVMGSLFIFIAGMVALTIGLAIARIQYLRRKISFEEFDLKLTSGLLNVDEVTIPYRHIQDINVERSILHQLTKTSRLIIDSAGNEEKSERNETDIVLDPIDRDLAEEVRTELERKVGVQVVQTEEKEDALAGAQKAEGE